MSFQCMHVLIYFIHFIRSFTTHSNVHAFTSCLHCVPFHAIQSCIHSSSPPAHPSIQSILLCIHAFSVSLCSLFSVCAFCSFMSTVSCSQFILIHLSIHPFVHSSIHSLSQSFIPWFLIHQFKSFHSFHCFHEFIHPLVSFILSVNLSFHTVLLRLYSF